MNSIPQDDTPQKQCNRCQQSFPATLEFFHKSKGGLHACCKKCRNRSLKPYNDAHVEDRKIRYQEHREEVSAKQKEYREANKVEISKQKRQSYQEHRKEIRAQHTQYRKAHREEINARKRQHYWEDRAGVRKKNLQNYREHREEKLIWAANSRNAHREEIYKRQRQAHQRNRALYLDQIRAHTQRRRARLRSIEGTLTVQQIQGKLKSQHYACYYCFRKFEKRKDRTYIYHLDHTVPISRTDFTPRNDASYVVLACPHCNQHKSDKLPHEWPEGGRLF